MSMRQHHHIALGPHAFHRIAYTEWGAPDNPRVVVCVHGLTRNGRDFDDLAAALADDFRVVCPDVVGRGRSDWLIDKTAYGYPQYCADITALIARFGVDRVDWVGTSMGGLIGMVMASLANSPVRRLVVNDVGPFIPKAALERLAIYVGSRSRFSDMEEVVRHFATVYAPFGPLTEAQWLQIAEHSVRQRDDGEYELRYDPAIANPFREQEIADVDLWAVWDAITCPTLALRGGESDLLMRATAEEMTCRGPKADLHEFAGIGHAPALMAGDQISVIRGWLLADG